MRSASKYTLNFVMIFRVYTDKRYILISLYYVVLQSLILVKMYILEDFGEICYFCYHAPILFAIAFYKEDKVIIRSLIIVGFVGQFAWLFDYISYLLFGKFIIGISRYMLRYEGIVYVSTLFAHVFSSFFALSVIYKDDVSPKSINYAFLYFLFIYILTLFNIIPASYNVNFVSKIRGVGTLPFQKELYMMYIIPIAILPGYYIQVLLKFISGYLRSTDHIYS